MAFRLPFRDAFPLEAARRRAGRLHQLLREREEALARFREELRRLDEERLVLEEALAVLHLGQEDERLGEALRGLLAGPFGLMNFFVARVDWDQERLHFPYFHEAGRVRRMPAVSLRHAGGLTAQALREERPLYLAQRSELLAFGAALSLAEQRTGLLPETWFGVPLGREDGSRPFGLVSFQSATPDAYPPQKRQTLEVLARILARAMG